MSEHDAAPLMVQVPYQTPDERAVQRLYRDLAVTLAIALLTSAGEIVARIATGELVGMKVVALALAGLVIKDVIAALVHLQRAFQDDALPTAE